MWFDIGDFSREIAACVPIALVKQFETLSLQCAASFDAGRPATAAADELPVQVRQIRLSGGRGL
jgi:hypothetical protein